MDILLLLKHTFDCILKEISIFFFQFSSFDFLLVCRNFVNSRICRIFSRDCYDYTGIKGWQMRRFCPKTCGICRTYWKRILDRYMGDLSREINVIKNVRRISPLASPKPTWQNEVWDWIRYTLSNIIIELRCNVLKLQTGLLIGLVICVCV